MNAFDKITNFVKEHESKISTVVNVLVWSALSVYAVATIISSIDTVTKIVKSNSEAEEGNTIEVPTTL